MHSRARQPCKILYGIIFGSSREVSEVLNLKNGKLVQSWMCSTITGFEKEAPKLWADMRHSTTPLFPTKMFLSSAWEVIQTCSFCTRQPMLCSSTFVRPALSCGGGKRPSSYPRIASTTTTLCSTISVKHWLKSLIANFLTSIKTPAKTGCKFKWSLVNYSWEILNMLEENL